MNELTNIVASVLLSVASQQTMKDGKYARMEAKPVVGNTNIVRKVVPYQGPKGNGYIVTLKLTTPTNIFTRRISVGPEKWLTTDWKRLPITTTTNKTAKSVK